MSTHTFETIKQELRGRVAILTLNRPEAMNAVNRDVAEGIAAAMEALDSDPAIRLAILTGRAACSAQAWI